MRRVNKGMCIEDKSERMKDGNHVAMLLFVLLVSMFLALATFASVPEVINDATITTEVKAVMVADKQVSASNINTKTENGIVTLSGVVGSDTEFNRAIELAYSINGVKDVNTDGLSVKSGAHPVQDSIITAKVKGTLAREKIFGDTPVAVTKVHVETIDGVVFLSGKVENKTQADVVEKLASDVKGVKKVKSNLQIG